MGFIAGRRRICALGVGRDLVRDLPKYCDVTLDPPGGTNTVPVWLEHLMESIKERMVAPPFRA